MQDRIRYAPLKDKITDPETAARFIRNGNNVFISGFTAGYPKLIPRELVRRAATGETFKINLFAGASTGSEVDGILAEAGLVNWRRPYMNDRSMRRQINADVIKFKDDHLSSLAGQVRAGNWGAAHVAVVEAVAVTEKGHLIPTMSVGNTPTYVREAEKIIIEIPTESGDFLRNGALTFIVTPSVAKDGRISAVVPMVSHVDHSEHSVDGVVTEHGLVDTRPLTPRQVAEQVIKKCAHADYRDMLWDYYQRAIRSHGGHEPHLLDEAFDFHNRYLATGSMKR